MTIYASAVKKSDNFSQSYHFQINQKPDFTLWIICDLNVTNTNIHKNDHNL